jgi:hypothetical protein
VKLPSADPVTRKNQQAFSMAKEKIMKRMAALEEVGGQQQLVASDKKATVKGS